jgi:ADP-ribosylglycohydrolase
MALHLVYHYSFKEAIFLAAGRGGDADSIAAIVGMLFGSY